MRSICFSLDRDLRGQDQPLANVRIGRPRARQDGRHSPGSNVKPILCLRRISRNRVFT
jgi:hypothetical protein